MVLDWNYLHTLSDSFDTLICLLYRESDEYGRRSVYVRLTILIFSFWTSVSNRLMYVGIGAKSSVSPKATNELKRKKFELRTETQA